MYYYIVNPTAGRGKFNRIQEKLRTRLQELGISGEFVTTVGEGDAIKLARSAIDKGATTIVAIGGDGTVNEVINGIKSDQVAVGIIPMGQNNQLANHFGITNWQQACDVLSARRISTYALIAAGQKFFLSDLTLGFETDPDAHTEETGTKHSRFKDLIATIKAPHRKEPLSCHIQVDDKFEVTADIVSLKLTNQKFHSPLADNKLMVSLYDSPPKLGKTKAVWELVSGRETNEQPATSRFFGKRLVVTTTPATNIMIDGKLAARTPVAIRLTDRRLRFITEKQISNIKASL